MAIGYPEDLFDAKELMTALQWQPLMTDRMLQLHRHQQQVMLNKQKQVEKKQMAISRINPQMHDHMVHIIKHEYPEIYEHTYCHGEFDHRFERLIGQGCQVEEAVHRTAEKIMNGHQDLQRMEIARKHTAGRSQANPYRGSIDDHGYGRARSLKEREMRHERDLARVHQQIMQETIQQMPYHQLSTTIDREKFKAKPKKKKLTILEQLQADVDVWLKDSLKLSGFGD